MLEQPELDYWLKTRGGSGLHVVLPLTQGTDYEKMKEFSWAW